MAPKYHGVDFYAIDTLLSEEERAVRDAFPNLRPVDAFAAANSEIKPVTSRTKSPIRTLSLNDAH